MLIASEKKDLYFATLKLSVGMGANRIGSEFFEKRGCCDEFIKTLIYCIEKNEKRTIPIPETMIINFLLSIIISFI